MNDAPDSHAAEAAARLGTVLRGKYRLDAVLGIGGMATVYAATHRNQKRFAVKVLHADISRDEGVRRRFLREGYIANGVGHAGAVTVLDDDVAEDGSAFLVMELLDGLSLETLWGHGKNKLPARAVLALSVQLLDVLEAAHAKGVVHRDVKPANLIVGRDGTVKILDFGIARVADAAGAAHATGSGMVLGTPAFMAPEQALGRSLEIGAATDLWSSGALAFALLSGQTVHEGESGAELIVKAGSANARSLAVVAPDAPPAVVALVDRALAFAPKDRWPSAAAMRDAALAAYRDLFGDASSGAEALGELVAQRASMGKLPATVDPLAETATSQPAQPAPLVPSAAGANLTTAKPFSRLDTTEPAGPRRRTRALAMAVAALLTLVVLGAVRSLVGRSSLAPQSAAEEKDAGGAASALVVTALPVPPTQVPAAAADYRAALQAYRDGDLGRATQLMKQAATEDPSMAGAHLRLAIWGLLAEVAASPDTRAAFARAHDLRGSLDERDRDLVAAFDPDLEVPPNTVEWQARLSALARARPRDAEILYFEASALALTGESVDADPWRPVLALDPDFGMVWASKAFADLLIGDVDSAKSDVRECLRIDSQSSSCLYFRSVAEAELGECAQMEVSCRALTSKFSSTPRWLRIALALAAEGAPRSALTGAIDTAVGLAKPEATRQLVDQEYRARLALLDGAFDEAERAAGAIVRTSTDASRVDVAYVMLTQIDDETGRSRSLARGVELWSSRSAGGHHLPSLDPARETHLLEPLLGRRLLRARRISPDAYAAASAVWASDGAADGPGKVERSWMHLQADAADTPEDASAALAALGHPVTLSVHADAGLAAHILGRLYFLAGRFDDALPALEAATRSCDALLRPVEQTRELEMLGEVRESKNDVAGACQAYGIVLDRWGKAVPSSVTAAKAKARSAALRCRR